jgi:uncharacterized protein YjiS (DUF1127 family)
MFTLTSRHIDTWPFPSAWLAPIASGIAGFWSRFRQKRCARLTSAELHALDDRMLKDIGLQRFQIKSAVLHGERLGWYAPLADEVWTARHRTMAGHNRNDRRENNASDALVGGPNESTTAHVRQNEDGHYLVPEGTARDVRGDETFEAPARTTVALSAAAADHSRQPTTEHRNRHHMAGSGLARRLVRAKNDPAKQRIRSWLGNMKDGQLLGLGMTSEEIAALRGTANPPDEVAISQGCDTSLESSVHEVCR